MPSPVNFILKQRVMRLRAAVPTAAAIARFGRRLPPLWPAHCLVCREPCAAQSAQTASACAPRAVGLCPSCRVDLPWNRSACARCALPMPLPTAACGCCLRRPPPLTETRAVFVYGPPLDRLLPRLKFHDDLAAGRLLAEVMAMEFARMRESDADPDADPHADTDVDTVAVSALGNAVRSRPDALIPLPLHRKRLRGRGYDQALELARPMAKQLGLPLRLDVLQRERDTSPQSRLNAAARRKNLRGAFTVNIDAIADAARSTPPLAHVVLIDDVMTTGATLHAAADALLRAGVARVDAWVCARVA
jgi:ComF family protein